MSIEKYLSSKTNFKKLKELPIFHTTLIHNLKSISESGLVPTFCQEQGRDLLYFFYGRSSYSKSYNKIDRKQISLEDCFFAVSMGFSLSSLDKKYIYKIFPFDSGALIKGKYDIYLGEHKDIEDFSIPANYIEVFIQEFFGDETNYLNGKVVVGFNNDNKTVKNLYDLMADTVNEDFDIRVRTIEISFEKKVPLDKLNILVIHDRFTNKACVKDLINRTNPIVLKYDTDEVGQVSDIYTLIRSKVKDFVKEYLLLGVNYE